VEARESFRDLLDGGKLAASWACRVCFAKCSSSICCRAEDHLSLQDPKEIYTEQYPWTAAGGGAIPWGARLNSIPIRRDMCIACDLCALACPEI